MKGLMLRLARWLAGRLDAEVLGRKRMNEMQDTMTKFAARTIEAERRLEERRVRFAGEEKFGATKRAAILRETGEEFEAIQAILEEVDVLWWEYCGNATQPVSGDRVIHGAHGAMDALALLKLRVKRMCEKEGANASGQPRLAQEKL
jgi:hypothetical protein